MWYAPAHSKAEWGQAIMTEQGWTWVEWLPIGISLLALAISIGGAWVAWHAPQAAARLAEALRSEAARYELNAPYF
jgi:hypothetical protein